MRGKDRRHIDPPLSTQWDGQSSLPLVEVGNDGLLLFLNGVLASGQESFKVSLSLS